MFEKARDFSAAETEFLEVYKAVHGNKQAEKKVEKAYNKAYYIRYSQTLKLANGIRSINDDEKMVLTLLKDCSSVFLERARKQPDMVKKFELIGCSVGYLLGVVEGFFGNHRRDTYEWTNVYNITYELKMFRREWIKNGIKIIPHAIIRRLETIGQNLGSKKAATVIKQMANALSYD